MSFRPSHSQGSQLLEYTDDSRRTAGSFTNVSMSRHDGKLHLRPFSPRHTPGPGIQGHLPTNRRQASNSGVEPPSRQIPESIELPPRLTSPKDEKQTSQYPDELVAKSPDPIPTGRPPQTPPNSTPKNSTTSTPVMGLPGTPNNWHVAGPSQELVAFPLSSPGQDISKKEHKPEWHDIQKLRADVWDLRSQIQQLRASLREKQDVKAAADDILFRRITYMTTRGLNLTDTSSKPLPGQKNLDQLMKDCQKARDEYGPLEDEANRVEDRLSQQEFKLAHVESQFYARKEAQIQSNSIQAPPETKDFDSQSDTLEEDEDFEEPEYHPLVNNYLSKMGDLDLLKERLDEFRDERAALEAEKQSRQRFGLSLDEEDQEWLDDAEEEYSEIIGKLQSLEKELAKLKRVCLSRNLIDHDGEPTGFQNQEESYFVELSSRDHTSEYVKYPLLLPPPGQKNTAFARNERKPDIASETATTRINEWLLNRLKISPLDVNLLASTFESTYGKVSKDWQARVLFSWYRDETIFRVASPEIAPPTSQASSMSTRHPDESSSEKSQEHVQGSVHVMLAPSNRSPSVISDNTERAFGMSRLTLSHISNDLSRAGAWRKG